MNFSNKSYTPKDEHMAANLEEHRKMEKRFQGLELKHIPRGENVEAGEIAKRASHRLAQPVGVFEERLFKPSASPPSIGSELPPALPPPPKEGLRTTGHPQATASYWLWQGRREWIGSSSSRLSSSAANFLRRNQRLEELCIRLQDTASKMVICTGVTPATSLRSASRLTKAKNSLGTSMPVSVASFLSYHTHRESVLQRLLLAFGALRHR
jgi:hypothetical protein